MGDHNIHPATQQPILYIGINDNFCETWNYFPSRLLSVERSQMYWSLNLFDFQAMGQSVVRH